MQNGGGGHRGLMDLQNLYYQNVKLKDMVFLVIKKLETFIEKTITAKERKK